MKKSEIVIGSNYIAKVSGKLTTVRVDDMLLSSPTGSRDVWIYHVTNLATGRRTTFRSATRFRAPGAPVTKIGGVESLRGASYTEIHVDRGVLPHLPERCPACDAAVFCRMDEGTSWQKITYYCGGEYRPKPQIQTHTDKWWGHCGSGCIKEVGT